MKAYYTRRFTALDKFKGIVDKIAIYDRLGNIKSIHTIQVDKNGYEYYEVDNPFDEYGLFTDKIKDAILCIRNGYADCIVKSNFLNMLILRKYIDKNYGKPLRDKTIEGFKNTKFAYAIKFTPYNSFTNDGLYLSNNNNNLLFFYDKDKIMTFDNIEDAKKYRLNLFNIAQNYFNEYIASGKNETYLKNLEKTSVIKYMFSDLRKNKDTFDLDIVQVIK
mgnify:FL=1